jgi:cation transporter-like permease
MNYIDLSLVIVRRRLTRRTISLYIIAALLAFFAGFVLGSLLAL